MREIPLTRGLSAMVDDEDATLVSQWKWYAHGRAGGFYAARRECHGGRLILMHRLINGTPEDMITDHIDGNGLNNRRGNLRDATPLQNMMNKAPNRGGSSPLKGAWFDPNPRNTKPWRSAIRLGGKAKYLGRFATQHEAAAAYAQAASEHFGDFACTERTAP